VHVSFDDGESWQSLRLNMPGHVDPRRGGEGRRPRGGHARPIVLDPRTTSLRSGSSRRRRSRRRRCCCVRRRPGASAGTRTRTRRCRRKSRRGQNPSDGADRALLPQDARLQLPWSWRSGMPPGKPDTPVRGATTSRSPRRGPQHPGHTGSVRPQVLSAQAGLHRFVWDLHHAPPADAAPFRTRSLRSSATRRASPRTLGRAGTYTLRLTVDGRTLTQAPEVEDGPAGQDLARGTARTARPGRWRSRARWRALREGAERGEGGPDARRYLTGLGARLLTCTRSCRRRTRRQTARGPPVDRGDPCAARSRKRWRREHAAPVDRRQEPRRPGAFSDTARALATCWRVMADQAFSVRRARPWCTGTRSPSSRTEPTITRPGWPPSPAPARACYFECYIVHDDEVGQRFADALMAARARGPCASA
jgi:hypothetical protein